MVHTDAIRWQVQLELPDPQAAANWLQENLFFSPVNPAESRANDPDVISLTSANLMLCLMSGDTRAIPKPPAGYYHAGLAHLALRTADVNAALTWCQSRQLDLLLHEGSTFFNPRVYGQGTRYFQVVTPFGLTIEISQRLADPSPYQDTLISGLCHLGVPAPSFKDELSFFEQLGFTPDFAPVTNWNAAEGTIYCCMVSRADPAGHPLTLEIYQFADLKPMPLPIDIALAGMTLGDQALFSPGGVRIRPVSGAE